MGLGGQGCARDAPGGGFWICAVVAACAMQMVDRIFLTVYIHSWSGSFVAGPGAGFGSVLAISHRTGFGF